MFRLGRKSRRLLLVLCWLVVLDQFVPALLQRLEHRRYESTSGFRLENSDLFALTPLVSYVREHPRGEQPRVGFIGNSVLWGYFVEPSGSVPAWYQRARPDTRVFNLAANGFLFGDVYLVAKATLGGMDRLFIQIINGGRGDISRPELGPLTFADEDDQNRFPALARQDRIERRLQRVASGWQLFSSSYRLQVGLFGSSARQYVYTHKGEWVRSMLAMGPTPVAAPGAAGANGAVAVSAPRASVAPAEARRSELRTLYPALWDLEVLVAQRRVRTTFMQVTGADADLADRDIADLNAAFSPFGEIVRITYPASLTLDGRHLSSAGARLVVDALVRFQREQAVDVR